MGYKISYQHEKGNCRQGTGRGTREKGRAVGRGLAGVKEKRAEGEKNQV